MQFVDNMKQLSFCGLMSVILMKRASCLINFIPESLSNSAEEVIHRFRHVSIEICFSSIFKFAGRFSFLLGHY